MFFFYLVIYAIKISIKSLFKLLILFVESTYIMLLKNHIIKFNSGKIITFFPFNYFL